jgi:two-component system sensor histidine kinase YesM
MSGLRALYARGTRLTIRARIILLFLAALCVYVLAVTLVYWQLLNEAASANAAQTARQSAEMLMSGVEQELANTRSISNNLLLNPDLTRWLRSEPGARDVAVTRNANQALIQTYATFPHIESIYIFDNRGEQLYTANHLTRNLVTEIAAAPWYARAVALNGGAFVALNALDTIYSDAAQNNISFIRWILDVNTMKPSGFLIINLNERFLSGVISRILQKYDTHFYIFDERGQSVLFGQEAPFPDEIPAEGMVRKLGGEAFFLYSAYFPEIGWTIVSSAPYDALNGASAATQLLLIPMLAAVVLFLVGSMLTANLVATPIRRLIASMQSVREGRFEAIPRNDRRDEIGQLEENYNIMIDALNAMLARRAALEQDKRTLELRVLTEQFKPHFLYNTLDSISYLIMAGDNARAREAVVSLSRFYNASLAKGSETASVGDEIGLIRNYLALQKIRYDDMIDDAYDITSDAAALPVLRNILQPLVENSIYHGIKPSGEPGIIMIRARREAGRLRLSVQDDGIGMTREQLDCLNIDGAGPDPVNFGLRGTINRLRLYYNRQDVCTVSSGPGEGTLVELCIPLPDATRERE